MTLTKAIARKVLNLVDHGLIKGAGGSATPGKVCVEQAVCIALGEPLSDEPSCVGRAVRLFKITLNDSEWSSDAARAKGMRKLAVAQLGSNEIDQVEFAKSLAIKCTQRIVPIALRRAAAKRQNKEHADKLEACAVTCEKADSLDAARDAARDARDAARAASAASAASYAARAASAASYAASAASAASYAARDASYAARAASAASAASYAARDAEMDRVLTVIADAALEVLIDLKSPGCKWLDVCEAGKEAR